MGFKQDKLSFLGKRDKSKKGDIDIQIRPLVDLINSHRDYFTTSSCAGRTVLINLFGSKKNQSQWFFKSHEPLQQPCPKLWEAAKKSGKANGTTWLKFEPFILHVRCNGIEPAGRMLRLARDTGMKKSGIIATSRGFVLEIEGTDRLETLVAKEGLLISEEYLNSLIGEINRKIKSNKKRINRFYRALLTSMPVKSQ